MNPLMNRKGQGLVEYLIIVALMGVATMGVIRIVGQNLAAKYGDIANVLQGKSEKVHMERVEDTHTTKKHLGNFMNGSASRNTGSEE